MTRIDRVVTSGTFSLDGETFDVDNNVWLVGDDDRVIVIDAAHDAEPIIEAVGEREVVAIAAARTGTTTTSAPPATCGTSPTRRSGCTPTTGCCGTCSTTSSAPTTTSLDGTRIGVGGVELTALHTPGHSPGSSCLYAPDLGTVFTGDTLFQGGPGATGRSFSDRPTIEASIRARLLALPADTVVRTGHGDSTTIGEEAARPPFS